MFFRYLILGFSIGMPYQQTLLMGMGKVTTAISKGESFCKSCNDCKNCQAGKGGKVCIEHKTCCDVIIKNQSHLLEHYVKEHKKCPFCQYNNAKTAGGLFAHVKKNHEKELEKELARVRELCNKIAEKEEALAEIAYKKKEKIVSDYLIKPTYSSITTDRLKKQIQNKAFVVKMYELILLKEKAHTEQERYAALWLIEHGILKT